MSLWLGILASSGLAGGDFESIATSTIGTGGAANIQFSNIPSTYQHLQLRFLVNTNGGNDNIAIRLNGDTGGNYTLHDVWANSLNPIVGTGALTAVTFARIGYWFDGGIGNAYPYVGIVDILDYANTSKNTTIRCFNGADANGYGTARINSSLWTNTSAVSSITLYNVAQNLPQHSTAALYGVKAP